MGQIVDHWKDGAAKGTTRYKEGVKRPKRDQNAAARAAKDLWEAGVLQAIENDLFDKGLERSSTAEWQKGAIEKGAPRFADGVRKSGDRYSDGFSPYHSVIESLDLPDKGPKNSEVNYERARLVGQALHQKKISG